MREAIPRIRRGNQPGLLFAFREDDSTNYASMIFPSATLNVNVRQYGQVIGISMVSGSRPLIVWFLVVATGPLHSGQFTMMVSMSGHWGRTVLLVAIFA